MSEVTRNPPEIAETELTSARTALRASDLRFQTLADAFPHMVWSTLPDGFHDYYNAHWYDFTGVPKGSTDGEEWNGMFHPDDQERAWARWRHSLTTGEPYDIEYRLRHHTGEYRWVLGRARAMHDEQGRIVRWMGTCTDIHQQKAQADQAEILSRELSHRIKNIFAVISGLVGMSARQSPAHKPFASELQQRIGALARAHELVRPGSEAGHRIEEGESLHELLRKVLMPYPAMAGGRVSITGEDFRIDDRGATPIALLVHELATNSIKYGALSTNEGGIAISTAADGDTVTMNWVEYGGPPIAGAPDSTGFGFRLAELSVVHQLGGTLERHWPTGGLETIARVPIRALAR